nr:MAG TPA: hypothetical protein [Caudoviricetes sp.]
MANSVANPLPICTLKTYRTRENIKNYGNTFP